MKHMTTHRRSIQLEIWTSPKVLKHVETGNRFAILPLGSIEQHGPHAPLGTDTMICREIGFRLARKLNGVLVPPVWYGISEEHMDFAGTVSINPNTFSNYVRDIIISLAKGGFRKILVLNGHGTHEKFFSLIQAKVEERLGPDYLNLLLVSYWSHLPPREREYLGSLKWGLHANAFETSLMAVFYPGLVNQAKDTRHYPDVNGLKLEDIDADRFRSLIRGSNGVWGDPEQASVDKGRSLLVSIESSLSNYITAEFINKGGSGNVEK